MTAWTHSRQRRHGGEHASGLRGFAPSLGGAVWSGWEGGSGWYTDAPHEYTPLFINIGVSNWF